MGPLEGIKIIEVAGIGPGPFCAMVLADMGADIIRVDRKGSAAGMMGKMDTLNRGRRSVTIDLKNPKENQKTSGFLPEEREWVGKFLDHGFVDVYRKLYPEREQYTWWTYRFKARERGVGWRIDYFLVSESLAQRVKDVIIHDDVLGSDHCPVELLIE